MSDVKAEKNTTRKYGLIITRTNNKSISAGIKSCVFEVFPCSGLILGRRMFAKKNENKNPRENKKHLLLRFVNSSCLPPNTAAN